MSASTSHIEDQFEASHLGFDLLAAISAAAAFTQLLTVT
jgi:hypothetical protein